MSTNSPEPLPVEADSLRGIFFKAAATLAMAVVAALVKALTPRYPIGEIVFCRSFFMLAPVFMTMALDPRGFALLKTHRPLAHLRRSLVGIIGVTGTFLALRYLPLADATALTFSSPLFLLAIAFLVLGERVGPYRMTAVTVGFLGVVLTTLPHLGDHALAAAPTLGIIFALTAAVAIAFVQLSLRALRDEPAATTVFYFALAITAASVVSLPFAFNWPDNAADWLMLPATGLVGGLSQLLLTHSYRHAEATVLAPFDYLQLAWAVIIGYVLFGEVPATLVILGALIIAASGVFIGMRERVLARHRKLRAHRLVGDEGIAEPLAAEGGSRTVAGQKGDVITERKQLLADDTDEGLVTAHGKIGPPDGP